MKTIIEGKKSKICFIIEACIKQMCLEDYFGCDPACRLPDEDENYNNCKNCYKKHLKNIDYFEYRSTDREGFYHTSDGELCYRSYDVVDMSEFIDSL